MRCFLMGFVGALLLLLCAVLVASQYSDYRARAETDELLAQVQSIQSAIEQNAVKKNSLLGAGRNIDSGRLGATNLDVFEITESSVIILRGGRDGQVVALIPKLAGGNITWRCVGGSFQAMPKKCSGESRH